MRVRAVLLCEEPRIVPERKQSFEKGMFPRVAVLKRIVVGEQKTAGEEGAFPRGQTVDVYVGAVTPHQAINHDVSLDRRDGAAPAQIVRRQEAHDRQQQQTRIELLVTKALCEGVAAF